MKRPLPWQKLLRSSAVLLLSLVFIVAPYHAYAQAKEKYTDTVYLTNGDEVTGILKEMDRGKLRFKTRTMDTVYIDWLDVESIESTSYMRITATDGTSLYGRMQRMQNPSGIKILDGEDFTVISPDQIGALKPIRVDESFLHQIEGDISAGVEYHRASDILLVNLASHLRYREGNYELGLGVNWNETQLDEGDNNSRADLSGDYTRLLEKRYFWRASLGFERNQELGIDLRSIAAGTAGRYLYQSSIMQFQLSAGLAVSAEDRTDNTSKESVEGLIRSSFDIFKLSVPMTRLSASINIFPGITQQDRLRVNSKITLRNEFIRDFFWDLSLYSNYDSQAVSTADESDFGIITSLGASF
jgi:hypothetical protein